MSTGFSFGSYIPGDSCVHRIDARIKLTLGIAFIVALLCGHTFASLGIAAAFVFLMYVLARIPAGKALRSLAPLMVIVLIVVVLNLFTQQGGETLVQLGIFRISMGGVQAAGFMGVRLTVMMLGMSLITLTTPTIELSEAFEKMLAPFARFGLPAHELGMIMGIALRFMPQFATELATVYHAQVSRGARLSNSPVHGVRMVSSLMIPLFASVFRHAETLSFAMDARCYHGGEGRTHLRPMRLKPLDTIATVVMAALVALVVLGNAL